MRTRLALCLAPALATIIVAGCKQAKSLDESHSLPAQSGTSNLEVESEIHPYLGHPFGTVIKVRGVVFDERAKGDDGPTILVQSIDGSSLRESVSLSLRPYFGKFGDTPFEGTTLPTLAPGRQFEFEGYETGGFQGTPLGVEKRVGFSMQTSLHCFHHDLVVFKGTQLAE